jgi:tRNA A-37 threonylcarbamoyl transferase component Bud32
MMEDGKTSLLRDDYRISSNSMISIISSSDSLPDGTHSGKLPRTQVPQTIQNMQFSLFSQEGSIILCSLSLSEKVDNNKKDEEDRRALTNTRGNRGLDNILSLAVNNCLESTDSENTSLAWIKDRPCDGKSTSSAAAASGRNRSAIWSGARDGGKSSDQLRREYAEDEKYDVRNSEIISSTIFAPPWSMPISIPYETLKVATNGFNEGKFGQDGNLVAEGSFSEVFHGMLADKQIAVKRLKKARSQRPSSILLSKRQFMNELSALTRCPPHENVIRLVGISDDGPELCLAYEFVEGKTLAQHLSKDSTEPLYWNERLDIAVGIARGIQHIQTSCKPPVIHRDVKSSNVLASRDLSVALADFGLSTVGDDAEDVNKSFVESGSTAVGTRCYMPPEAFKGVFSTRTDVYSFGMILFELLSGLPPYSWSKKIDLIAYLKECEDEGIDLTAMADPRAMWPDSISARLMDLAKKCTESDSHKRPFISKVLKELEFLASGKSKGRKKTH